MNEHTEPALVSVQADWLLREGVVVKDLLSGATGQGLNRLILEGDGYRLFHITPAQQSQEEQQTKKGTN
jgi:predicted Rdx family selenoprotein